jgi:alpha-1,2-glucosyltransferase
MHPGILPFSSSNRPQKNERAININGQRKKEIFEMNKISSFVFYVPLFLIFLPFFPISSYQTLVCCLYPLHYFYTFLYYTDVASTFFTLSAWLAARRMTSRLAGLLGGLAVLMRQTNAVWVAFIAARSVIEICLLDFKQEDSKNKGKKTSFSKNNDVGVDTNLTADVSLLLQRAWTLRFTLVSLLWPLLSVVLAFAGFVLHNGGIVVGDKDNHVPVRHLMQPFYFVLYSTICLAPAYWTSKAIKRTVSKTLTSSTVKSAALVFSLATITASAINKGTLVHPFLLADNRHYTFYLWRRVINCTPWMRYALIPAYIYGIVAINALFAGSCGKRAGQRPIERILFAATVAVVLIPAHLIEFRYYTIAFYALFMMSSTPSVAALVVTATGFAVCDAVTLYVFAMRPFAWGDGSIARFMW